MGRFLRLVDFLYYFLPVTAVFVDTVQNVCYFEKCEISRKKYRHGKELPYGGKV